MEQHEVSRIVGCWFVGYGLGVVLFFLPNYYGRQPAMKLAIIAQTVACILTLYSDSVNLRKLGFLIQGVWHYKGSLSYNYVIEFMPESKKAMATNLITVIDDSVLITLSLCCLIFTRDIDTWLRISFLLQLLAAFLFLT
jgi:hypothetical protein